MAEAEIETKTYGMKMACCQPFVCLPIVWASISGLGLSTVGVYDLLKADGHFFTGIFLLSVGVIVLLLESISVLALTCCRKITCCHKYTKVVGWFDTWKRGLVYAIVGAICFLAILRTKYSIVCGISMILAGSLYILKACKVRSVKRSAETDRKALTQDFHDGQKLDV